MFVEDPRVQAIWKQIITVLVLLERPVVQRQLAAFALVIIASWLLSEWLQRSLNRLLDAENRHHRLTPLRALLLRALTGVEYTFFPFIGLALGELLIGFFQSRGWRFGLIGQLMPLFWLLLAYRLLTGIVYTFLVEERAYVYKRRFVRPLFLILVILSFVYNFAASLSLGDIEIATFQGVVVTTASLLTALLLLYIFFTLAWLLHNVLNRFLKRDDATDRGMADTIISICYYAVLALGMLTAVSALGFDLSSLAIIVGGISVGIGFGLQDLVNNFVSGVLLLFERTVRPGDVIEVGGQRGVVERLRIRSTMLRTIDNIELIVPNKNLLASAVSTYTQSDRIIRRVIPVGVSYESDPGLVRQLLLDVAAKHGKVLKKPAPTVYFTEFGPSSLDFQLAVFIGEPTIEPRVLSDLRFMIWTTFQKHNIEIPYPQQDLHVRNVPSWSSMLPLNSHDGHPDQIPNDEMEKRKTGERIADKLP
ncbi:mechanosensitive ion channel [Chloroflexi bacterium TSY]|nr:mechanosensitive ion channel [Chloroflexi bacterium TSY]